MNSLTDNFKKKHDLLICVDSDGCAMNTMDIKHFTCFQAFYLLRPLPGSGMGAGAMGKAPFGAVE